MCLRVTVLLYCNHLLSLPSAHFNNYNNGDLHVAGFIKQSFTEIKKSGTSRGSLLTIDLRASTMNRIKVLFYVVLFIFAFSALLS